MDKPGRIAKAWLKLANSKWLNYFTGSALSDPTQQVLNKLQDAKKNNETKQTWDLINHLQRLSETVEAREAAEIFIWCGLIAAEMDNFREALKYFMRGAQKYATVHHHRAVAGWMEGCIYWLLPHKEVDAISTWRSSIQQFESLRDHYKHDLKAYHWYEKRCKEMFDALHQAVQEYKIPPLPKGEDIWTDEADIEETSLQNDKPTPRKYTPNNHNDPTALLQFIPVYDHISAGKFDVSGILEQPVSHMEVDHVVIEGIPHRIHSITSSRLLNLPALQEHYILKVSGNSMNRARPVPIEPNDYVLMRRQFEANDGNIVAATIIREDPLATLKRYYHHGGEHILQPESDDPKWQERILMKEAFRICGIALAVLKKIQD